MANLILRPRYVACVSGGKDSLYMLYEILKHPDIYPLDEIVHYQLEIDWPFVDNVCNKYEELSKRIGIPFRKVKPRISYYDLLEKNDIPTRVVRWCNSMYKLDAQKELENIFASFGCRPVCYVGLCADEESRFKFDLNDNNATTIYPLAELGIIESVILEWAKNETIFEGWYKHHKRQGCMYCPCLSRKELAYMLYHYPQKYNWFMEKIRSWEKRFNSPYFGKGKTPNCDQWSYKVDNMVRKKWVRIIENEDIKQVNIERG